MLKGVRFKTILLLAVGVVLSIVVACSNDAQDGDEATASKDSGVNYPEDTIEFVVPASAGGDTDRNARLLSQYLEDELGVSIVIQNITGSSGSVGVQEVIDAEPNGYKVLYFHNNVILNNLLGVSDNTFEDLKIVGISELDNTNGLVVGSDAPYDTLEELVEAAKENPKGIDLATTPGAFTHIQMTSFAQEAGIEFNIVDGGDFAERNAALLGGHIDVLPIQLGLVDEYIKNGDMKALGVLSDERIELYQDIPTFKEQGIDAVFEKFFFLALPKDTPDEIADTLAQAVKNVIENNDEYLEKAESFGLEPQFIGGEDALELMKNNQVKYEGILESN